MVVKVPTSRILTAYQLIERDAHVKFNLRKIPIWKYLSFNDAADRLGIPPEDLVDLMYSDKRLFAFRVPEEDDELLFHPDGILAILKQKFRRDIQRALKCHKSSSLNHSRLYRNQR